MKHDNKRLDHLLCHEGIECQVKHSSGFESGSAFTLLEAQLTSCSMCAVLLCFDSG